MDLTVRAFVNNLLLLIVVHSSSLSNTGGKKYAAGPKGEEAHFGEVQKPFAYVIQLKHQKEPLGALLDALNKAKHEVLSVNIYNDLDSFLKMDADFKASNATDFKDFFHEYKPVQTGWNDNVGLIRKVIDKVSAIEEFEWVKKRWYLAAVTEGLTIQEVEEVWDMPCDLEDASTILFRTRRIDSMVGVLNIEQRIFRGSVLEKVQHSVVILDMDRGSITVHDMTVPDLQESFRVGTHYVDKVPGTNLTGKPVPDPEPFVTPNTNTNFVFSANRVTRKTINQCFIQINRYQRFHMTSDKRVSSDLIYIPREVVSYVAAAKWRLMKNPVRMMLKVGFAEFESDSRERIPMGRYEAFIFVQMYRTKQRELRAVFTMGRTKWEGHDVKSMEFNMGSFSSVDSLPEVAVNLLKEISEKFGMTYDKLVQKLRDTRETILNFRKIFEDNTLLEPRVLPIMPQVGWFLQFREVPGVKAIAVVRPEPMKDLSIGG